MRLSLKKREKFVISTLLVSVVFLLEQLIGPGARERQWHILSLVALVTTIWSLWGSWDGLKIIPLLVLPLSFPLGMILISSLLPNNWIVILLMTLVFGFSFYSLLLIENIYAVSAIRTIPLIRAAHSVGFLFTLVTAILLFHTLYSFYLSPWLNGGIAFMISLPLALQSLWAIKLEDTISRAVLERSIIGAIILGELALILSFWPANSAMKSLFLTSSIYTVLGIFHHEIQDKMKSRYALEYFVFGAAVLLILSFSTSWRG